MSNSRFDFTIDLDRGGRFDFTKDDGEVYSKIQVELTWKSGADLDACAFLLGEDGIILRDEDFIYFKSNSRWMPKLPLTDPNCDVTDGDFEPFDMKKHKNRPRWRKMTIPVSADGLKDTHYKGGTDVVALYLANNPKSRIFDGRALILGGSHAPNYTLPHSLVGDLSAILIENINPLANLVRVPQKKTALLSDFELKRDRIAAETLNKNVTNISGVPSWMMSVLVRVLELSGKKHLEEVWPNLEVFFHGGIAFTPYRKQYEKLITKSDMRYMETYNASEGFFGIQNDPTDPSMLLMLDYGVFYEFIPMDEFGTDNPTVVPLSGVETGKNYAMLITTSCGLWRYLIGDTVRFTSKNPYKFVITGRTKYFINAFGEEVIMDNAEKALSYACQKTGAQVSDYTAAPVFMDQNAKCRHQWLVEFTREPEDIDEFATLIDNKLQEVNSDYEAKRFHDVTLQRLEVVKARRGLFNDWLKSKGKLGGQHKVPRLSNSRKNIDELLDMNVASNA